MRVSIEKLNLEGRNPDIEYELVTSVVEGGSFPIPTERKREKDGGTYDTIVVQALKDGGADLFHVSSIYLRSDMSIPGYFLDLNIIKPIDHIEPGGEMIDWVYKDGKTVEEVKISCPKPPEPENQAA